MFEDVGGGKISVLAYVGIGDVQEMAPRRYVCEPIEDRIGRAKVYGFLESGSKEPERTKTKTYTGHELWCLCDQRGATA